MLDLKACLPFQTPVKALDVGTRFGEFAYRLADALPRGSQLIGLDCDPAAVAQAAARCTHASITFLQGFGDHLEFPENAFQVVALSNTLHHLPDYGKVLEEMLRVLSPGGVILINEMYRDQQDPAQQTHAAQHTLEARIDCLTGGYQRQTWTRAELLDILGQLPLSEVQIQEYQEDPELDQKLASKTAKLEESVAKLRGHPEYPDLLAEARRVQALCAAHGIRRCTQLLYAGRK